MPVSYRKQSMPKLSSKYQILDDELVEQIAEAPEEEQGLWLILQPHPEFEGHWIVECLESYFQFDLGELIGPYRAVSPAKLGAFLEAAEDYGYQVAFAEDPEVILGAYEHLNDPPEFSLNSDLPNTINGFLPFQLQGFNKVKDLDGAVAVWSTGTGKTVLATAYLKYHLLQDSFDVAFVCVKSNNKINTQRTLERLGDVSSIAVTGPKAWRRRIYENILAKRAAGEPVIVVINYEKFRDDFATPVEHADGTEVMKLDPAYEEFFTGRLLCIWDEMPMKLKNRSTKLYQAISHCLYRGAPAVNWERRRPAELRQLMLSATPIENDPEDFFNCVRLLDPRIFGTVNQFRNEFVASYNFFNPHKPERWQKLDKMQLMVSHIVHQVDKRDPDIAAMFPKVIEEPYFIDWSDHDRKVYDTITGRANKLVEANFDEANVLALIGLMQMLCDAPTMVNDSAARREAFAAAWEAFEGGQTENPPDPEGSEVALELISAIGNKLTNKYHTKLLTLEELLTRTHPDEKALIFTSYNELLLPLLSEKLDEWGVSHVVYAGTDKQKQDAEDTFRSDPSVRVFLSSDAGSDSINLPEASVVIHYDFPWKWSVYIQRENRAHRVTSEHPVVRYYSLAMADSIEDRKRAIIMQKKSYHEAVFEGKINEEALSSRMSKDDLLYILTGERY